MKKNPLVSIIIPCYNYGEYVQQAIKSALNQTYKNIEIIVINDGSTDDSEHAIKKYTNHENIIIISRENKGIIYTRNEGVSLAKGVYIMQLDADDIIEPNYVEECIKKAEKEKLDVVYTQTHTFGRVEYDSCHPEFSLEKLKHFGYIHASSLVRKSKMEKAPYDPYLDKLGNEDWDLFLNMCLDGATAGLVNKPLLNYRKHIDRKSRADNFEGLFKESLVTHHIWSKQNTKHPEEFWYFSSQINQILETITLYQEHDKLKDKLVKQNQYIKQLESRDILLRLRRVKKRLTSR